MCLKNVDNDLKTQIFRGFSLFTTKRLTFLNQQHNTTEIFFGYQFQNNTTI
jgi:hypothetical protein